MQPLSGLVRTFWELGSFGSESARTPPEKRPETPVVTTIARGLAFEEFVKKTLDEVADRRNSAKSWAGSDANGWSSFSMDL